MAATTEYQVVDGGKDILPSRIASFAKEGWKVIGFSATESRDLYVLLERTVET